MAHQSIPFSEFNVNAHSRWDQQWLLLTAGDFEEGRFNAMTVAWGSFGTMWNKPFAQVVVRPQRYTYEFMEDYATFTLCGFPEEYRQALQVLGTKSGRDSDKLLETGITAVAASKVAAPAFQEANLVVECKQMYWDDFDPTHFLDVNIEKNYPKQDYHRIYFGEIVAISGENTNSD